MVLPICQRVTYCSDSAPVTCLSVADGLDRLSIWVITLSVIPSADRFSRVPRMSMPGTLAPLMTGKSASPRGSGSPLTGALVDPGGTSVPSTPGPDDCRAIVMTPAPQWSATCAVQIPP